MSYINLTAAQTTTTMHFDGPDLTAKDKARLTGQALRVFDAMVSGEWYSLRQIAIATYMQSGGRTDSEASISARLRQLRGLGYQIDRRRRVEGGGLFEYRMATEKILA